MLIFVSCTIFGRFTAPDVIQCDAASVSSSPAWQNQIFFATRSRLAGGTRDRVWRVDPTAPDSYIESFELPIPYQSFDSLVPSPQGTYVAHLIRDANEGMYQPALWHVNRGIRISVPATVASGVHFFWTTDENCLIIIDNQLNLVKVFHLATGQLDTWTLPGHFVVIVPAPNGRWLATLCDQSEKEICILKPNGQILTRFRGDSIPVWSFNSRYLLFYDGAAQNRQDRMKYMDTEQDWRQYTLSPPTMGSVADWSQDKSRMMLYVFYSIGNSFYAIIEFPTGREITRTSQMARSGVLSPDGQQFAMVENGTGGRSPGIYITDNNGNERLIYESEQVNEIRLLDWTTR